MEHLWQARQLIRALPRIWFWVTLKTLLSTLDSLSELCLDQLLVLGDPQTLLGLARLIAHQSFALIDGSG